MRKSIRPVLSVISAKRGLKAMVMMLPCTSKLRTYNCTSVTTFASKGGNASTSSGHLRLQENADN